MPMRSMQGFSFRPPKLLWNCEDEEVFDAHLDFIRFKEEANGEFNQPFFIIFDA